MDRETLLKANDEALAWAGYLRVATDAWDAVGGFAAPLDTSGDARGIGALPDGYTSYIQPHPAEPASNWRWRVRRATYVNLARIVGDTLLGFLFGQAPSRNLDDLGLGQWAKDVDGHGLELDAWLELAAAHMLLYPACVVHVGAPATVVETMAQAREVGTLPWIELVHPASVWDWRHDSNGRLTSVKLVDTVRDGGVLEPEARWTRVVVYDADGAGYTVQVWRVRDGQYAPERLAEGRFAGALPIVMQSVSRSMSGSLFGSAPLRTVVEETRGLYNDMSLLDEAVAAQCFAMLALQVPRGVDEPEKIVLGPGNVLTYQEGLAAPQYVVPSTAPLDTLRVLIEMRVRRAYRVVRLEFALGDTAPQSGVSRQYEFAACNRSLHRVARALTVLERSVVARVGELVGVDTSQYVVSWPTDFDVRDVDLAVRRALDLVLLPLGPTAKARLMGDLRDTVVDLSPDERGVSDAEIAEQVGAGDGGAASAAPAVRGE